MNIFDSLTETNAEQQTNTDIPVLLVAPYNLELPKDGILDYISISSPYDLKDMKPDAVVMFQDSQLHMLKALCEYPDVFGYQVVVLSGVPGMEYTPHFEAASYTQRRVAYHTTINDILELARREQDSAAITADSSKYEKERSTYIRKSGEAKEFVDFAGPAKLGGHLMPSDPSDGIADGE